MAPPELSEALRKAAESAKAFHKVARALRYSDAGDEWLGMPARELSVTFFNLAEFIESLPLYLFSEVENQQAVSEEAFIKNLTISSALLLELYRKAVNKTLEYTTVEDIERAYGKERTEYRWSHILAHQDLQDEIFLTKPMYQRICDHIEAVHQHATEKDNHGTE